MFMTKTVLYCVLYHLGAFEKIPPIVLKKKKKFLSYRMKVREVILDFFVSDNHKFVISLYMRQMT